MADVPPWLDFTPATFVGAAEAGQRLRQGEEQIGLERARLGEEAASRAAQVGMEQQRLAQAEKQAGMENQLRQQQLAATFQRAQTQAAIAQAYHEAQIGLAKGRLDQEGQRLRQGQNIKVGTDVYHYDPATGRMTKILTGTPTAKGPTVTVPFPNPSDPQGTAGTVRGTPLQVASLMGTNAPPFLQNQAALATTAPTPNAPNPGDVIDGYRFKGGDPSQETNWEAAAANQ